MSRTVYALMLGKMKYAESWLLQQKIAAQINECTDYVSRFRNVLIVTEHDPVYTVGIRTDRYTNDDEVRLRKLGAEFFRTNRGGLITFHGPGQLVAYPILNLKIFTPSVRWYINQLEAVVISVCKQYGVDSSTTENPGVWVENRKICSVGVRASRYVTTHGLALNCNTDLTWFDHIYPCGLESKMTSLANETGTNIDLNKVKSVFMECFAENFDCKIIVLEALSEDKILSSIVSKKIEK